MEFNHKLKYKREDFVVTEIPLLPNLHEDSVDFSHTYLWLYKTGLTTFEAIDEIIDHFKLGYDDVSHEGLKDEEAITHQILSIKKVLSPEVVHLFNSKYSDTINKLKIKEILGFGDSHVDIRNLHGNSFTIVIRNLEKELAKDLFSYCQENRFIPFVNYYDDQRFGMDGGPYNTNLIGENIIKSDWQSAFNEFQQTKNMTPDLVKLATNLTTKEDFKGFFKKMNPNKLSFFISSYNSFLWNQQASKDLQSLNDGKIFNFNNIGSLFVPDGINFQAPTISKVDGYEFNQVDFAVGSKVASRNLIVTTTVFPLSLEEDDAHPDKSKIEISFFLPTGCYATMLIKQIITKVLNNR